MDEYNAFLIALYVISMVLIVVGNSAVIVLLLRRKHLRTATNYFILSLSASDLVIGCFVVPSSLYEQIVETSNVYKCNIVPYLQLVSVGASIYSLVGIGLDRYRALVQADKPKVNERQALTMIAVVWFFSLLYGTRTYSYYLHPHKAEDIDDDVVVDIGDNWTHKEDEEYEDDDEDKFGGLCNLLKDDEASDVFVRWADMFVLLFFPIGILVVCYIKIGMRLWGRSMVGNDPQSLYRKKRAIKMLVLVVILFTISWAPFHLLEVTLDTRSSLKPDLDEDRYDAYKQVTIMLALCNSWMNPIVYVAMNNVMKSEIKSLCRCLFPYSNAVAPDLHDDTSAPPEQGGLITVSQTIA